MSLLSMAVGPHFNGTSQSSKQSNLEAICQHTVFSTDTWLHACLLPLMNRLPAIIFLAHSMQCCLESEISFYKECLLILLR